ncbi:MAG: hypothetical protein DCC49_08520 [Acidobacteria bacterium]|nr:MAG: hypothetical protein DCC49_08520 [Acidobacteriota bacterium]
MLIMDETARKHLCDIEVAAALIRGFVAGSDVTSYESDDMIRSSVERQLQVIGTAVKHIGRGDDSLGSKLPGGERFAEVAEMLDDPFGEVSTELTWGLATELLDPIADAATELIESSQPA